MSFADKLRSGELPREERDLCPPGTYVFQVTKTFARNKEGEIVLGKNGDGAGLPEVSLLVAPLRDPQNAKSVDRDLGLFAKVTMPIDVPGAKPVSVDTYKKLLNRVCNLVGTDRLPAFDWKDKGRIQEVADEVETLGAALFAGEEDLDGCTFIAEVVHTTSPKDNKTYANLRGIRQELGDAQLSSLE